MVARMQVSSSRPLLSITRPEALRAPHALQPNQTAPSFSPGCSRITQWNSGIPEVCMCMYVNECDTSRYCKLSCKLYAGSSGSHAASSPARLPACTLRAGAQAAAEWAWHACLPVACLHELKQQQRAPACLLACLPAPCPALQELEKQQREATRARRRAHLTSPPKSPSALAAVGQGTSSSPLMDMYTVPEERQVCGWVRVALLCRRCKAPYSQVPG